MRTLPALHGVVPILVTPFDEHDRLDVESLRSLTEFTIAAGVHGLGIALGSEVYALSDAERDTMVSTVVDQARDRVPVLMNTGSASTETAVRFSRQAQELGVRAVICTSPGAGTPVEDLLRYYGAISDAVDVPIVVQDTADNHVPPQSLCRLGRECARVEYAKVESAPPARRVYDAVEACGAAVRVFGGAGGAALLQELRRGSVGTMPWPSTPAAFVTVWDRWLAGDADGAQEAFDRGVAPALRLGAGGLGVGQAVHKELLRRQGVIRTARVRDPAEVPDPVTWQELDEYCRRQGIDSEGADRP